MNKTYVTVVSFGSYEDKDHRIIYAGNDYEKAQVIPENWANNGDINYIHLEHWENGEKVGNDLLKD